MQRRVDELWILLTNGRRLLIIFDSRARVSSSDSLGRDLGFRKVVTAKKARHVSASVAIAAL
jgi:hypothetical protein